jgi:hypothetical protein
MAVEQTWTIVALARNDQAWGDPTTAESAAKAFAITAGTRVFKKAYEAQTSD